MARFEIRAKAGSGFPAGRTSRNGYGADKLHL
jgi:hypothetical protein